MSSPLTKIATKSDALCDKLRSELADLKSSLSKECDLILGKIDDLLDTEILTLDKAWDYRLKSDSALDEGQNHESDLVAIHGEVP